jgi:hypothetical protein
MPPLPNPAPGEVIFHAACRPALEAGDYDLRVEQQLTRTVAADGHAAGAAIDVGGQPLPGVRSYGFTVDGPRFTLDGSLIHAVFPPTNGRGVYVSRLPMIVLRRRTLPWERTLAAPAAGAPWLAVLLFEEGEVTTISPCTVGDVLDGAGLPNPAKLALPAQNAAARALPCIAIDLPLTLFREIAPMPVEIPLLCHVRQVSTQDKELLGMDDDGWFAVVVGNRIPEPGKKYVACLVSLEGAEKWLPTSEQAAELKASDLSRPLRDVYAEHATELLRNAVFADPDVDRGAVERAVVDRMVETGSKYAVLAPAASSSVSGRVSSIRDAAWSGIRAHAGASVSVLLQPDTLRLFCLAQWTFECLEGGDFKAIMQALPNNGGVAMLGMPPALAQAPGGQGAAAWRAALDTGHVPLEHLTREGERTIAWYRGPLTPVGVARSGEGPFHTSDQARRIDPETGLENLGYAAAFEIGRLLALGDPRFALDLLRWRRGDRMGVEAGITLDVMHRFAERLIVDVRFHARLLEELPRHLAAHGLFGAKAAVTAGRLGPLGDPSGLAIVRDRLPGLDAARVAAVRNYDVGMVQGILEGVAVGGGVLLDELGVGGAVTLEQDIDRIAADPQRHVAQLGDVFTARLRDLTRGR